ncbi:MAG: hypothetical protein U1E67_08345 [Hyphomicrobiales bacterium]
MGKRWDRLFKTDTAITLASWVGSAWPNILAFIAGGGLVTWAAKTTAWLEPWGNLGLAAAILGGIMIVAAFMYLFAKARDLRSRAALNSALASKPVTINPLAGHFTEQVIDLNAFYDPTLFAHANKSFDRCHLRGPSVVFLQGATHFENPMFVDCNFVVINEGDPMSGLVVLGNPRFVSCHFFNITIFMTAKMALSLRAQPQLKDTKFLGRPLPND